MLKSGDIASIIDIGSNAIRHTVFQVDPHGQPIAIHRARYPVRLGSGTFADSNLAEPDIRDAIEALHEIMKSDLTRDATVIRAIATSAVRDAANRDHFIDRVRQATGLEIQVITGADEARYAALGAATLAPPGQPYTVIDIGGGSTEIAFTNPDHPHSPHFQSLPLGAVRLSRQWGMHDLYDPQTLQTHRAAIDEILRTSLPQDDLSQQTVIGMGGAIKSLAAIANHLATISPANPEELPNPEPPNTAPPQPQNHLDAATITTIRDRLAKTPAPQMPETLAVDPARTTIILAGAEILHALTNHLQIRSIHPTNAGIPEGLVHTLIQPR